MCCIKYMLIFIGLLLKTIFCASFTSQKIAHNKLPVVMNKIIGVNATCDSDTLNVTVTFQMPFKGALFARDFSQDCREIGISKNSLTLNLPTSGCGIQLRNTKNMTSNSMNYNLYYDLVIVAQQDRFLQQIADQETQIQCHLRDIDSIFKQSEKIHQILESLNTNKLKGRTGKVLEFPSNPIRTNNGLFNNKIGRVWMEVVPTKSKRSSNKNDQKIQVGEPVMLRVKFLNWPPALGWRIVDCVAHDGLDDAIQRLLDQNGCPIDEQLMPEMKLEMVKGGSSAGDGRGNGEVEAFAKFAAFKFPDRDRVHMNCDLEVCRGECQKIDCSIGGNDDDEKRFSRTLKKNFGEEGEILDRLQVFNSVQIIAPDIDNLKNNNEYQTEEGSRDFLQINLKPIGDRTLCVSTNKVALAFCILGLIFLVAIVVTFCAIMRARRRRRHHRKDFSNISVPSNHNRTKHTLYSVTNSNNTKATMFSSNSSNSEGGSIFGSKLLQFTNSSGGMITSSDHNISSSSTSSRGGFNNMGYGRIF